MTARNLRMASGFNIGKFCYNKTMQKYTAIILASREANEFDRIYVLYTREMGLIRVIGKGVRKPAAKLAGHLEPATLSEVYVARSKGMGQITSAITLETFENIKKDFGKLDKVLKIFRFFARNFAEGEKDERIFGLLRELLENLENKGNWGDKGDKGKILIEAFWWKLFDFLGQRPEVMKCVNCRKKLTEKSKKFFSVEKGGIICAGCASNFKGLILISDNQIKLLRIFWGNTLAKIEKVRVEKRELERLKKIKVDFERYNFQNLSN